MEEACIGADNLTSTPNDTIGLENVTDMRSMFAGATAFNSDIDRWNVSGVTYMRIMFAGVTLSLANYDALLVGWARGEIQPLLSRVPFNASASLYSAAATAARAVLTILLIVG